MQSQEVLFHFVPSLYCWVQGGHCSYIWVWGPLVLSCCTNTFNCLWLSRLLSPQNCLYSHRVLWSLAPWIEPSVRLSVCGWVLCLTRRWDLASLEWRWGLCRWLPALGTAQDKYIFRNRQQTAGRHRAFANKLLVTRVRMLKVPAGVTLPSVLVRPPFGGGCPFCDGPLSVSPDGNEENSWQLSLWWTLQQRSAWTVQTHTDPGSLVREPWPHMSSDLVLLDTGVCSLIWRLTMRWR